jgi:hypothetical protein
MFQTIQDKHLFVVDVPANPHSLLPITDGGNRLLRPYADALEEAILRGLVRTPGKYGIELEMAFLSKGRWQIYAINE